ncbi:DUF3035 domain-containing protein [Altericroceibacterium spongiae]|uniref:DUF3035 domain-containing protein n=1 Tax=Altericroceibacterium spongiae TaxID=2320269 RepID=A0A420EIJ5_9SPHN|nr:DUF3035 domain-containing protein [Altericroceibacterium spongiae]RKF20515.1 DUF3035 domain-containing protein [Altericroceibacterium spongiae]
MRNTTRFTLIAASCSLLAACGGNGIFNRERPDEFAVQRQAPLVVPPDFQLVPPASGAPRPAEGSASQQALDALFGGKAERSDVENDTLSRAGDADPGIRSEVGSEKTYTVDKGTDTRAILSAPQGDGQAARAVTPS